MKEFRVELIFQNQEENFIVADHVVCEYETEAVVLGIQNSMSTNSIDDIFDMIYFNHVVVYQYDNYPFEGFSEFSKVFDCRGGIPSTTWHSFIEDTIRKYGICDFAPTPINQDELFALLEGS